jgi:acetyl esterase
MSREGEPGARSPLHPQARALLQRIAASGLPPVHTQSPVDARRSFVQRRRITQPDPPAVHLVLDLTAPGARGEVPVRLYRPMAWGPLLPCLVFFHGGGWVIGDLESHDVLCRQLSIGSGCAIVAVDYALAPEHPFPAAIEDCMAATRWVHAQASTLGVDPARIGVGGDSAGGTLAAVVAITARDANAPPLAWQMLVYPTTDQRRATPSHRTNASGFLLTAESLRWYHDNYLGSALHDSDWRASPLACPDLGGLPPALVLVAGFDPLRDEGIQYAQALDEAGTRATLIAFERQIHGFVTMGRVIDEANDAVALLAAAMRQALSVA